MPDALSRGYAVNSSPAVGAVAWETKPPYGHVAWVSSVSGSSVTVEEYNEHGNGTYDVRTVPISAFQYIHFKDFSAAPAPPATPTPPPVSTPSPVTSTTRSETAGGLTNTWSDYSDAGGNEGQPIAAQETLQVSCRITGFTVADGNSWWYQIASSPWSGNYYVSADAFYNNGETSGVLQGTPFVDPNVPGCSGAKITPPAVTTSPPGAATTTTSPNGTTSTSTSSTSTTSTSTTSTSTTSTSTTSTSTTTSSTVAPPLYYNETVGGATHTWTDYGDAGGTEGPSIASGQTVQVACVVTGFRVSDGDTYWYRIASAPWDNSYFASADAFYNNGQTSGSLHGTPFVDPSVPGC